MKTTTRILTGLLGIAGDLLLASVVGGVAMFAAGLVLPAVAASAVGWAVFGAVMLTC